MDVIELGAVELDVPADEVGSNVSEHRFAGKAPEAPRSNNSSIVI
jgi:hypothetical protein